MKKLKVVTLVGTRPEIIKLSLVIKKLDTHTDHCLVHTGQNFDYELNEVFFKDLEIRRPDHFLSAAGGSAAETISTIISKFDQVLASEKPDAILVYGDTNSCLGAIAAKKRKIPIFHMEAGNRCFDQRVPEEINRKIIDHLSDVNIVHSEHARRYLLAEGLKAELILKSGSPMPEIFEHFKPKMQSSQALESLGVKEKNYFVVSLHREENVDDKTNLLKLIDSLKSLHARYGHPIIFSTHPRTKKRMDEMQVDMGTADIRLMKPFGFFDYLKLQTSALCTLSDSGTLTEESSLLGFPAVMMREAHERPEGMDESAVIMAGLDSDSVLRSVELSLAQQGRIESIKDYSAKNVSDKVVRWIFSYTSYVNRTVWQKKELT